MAFLLEKDLGGLGASLRVEEGSAFEAISAGVDRMRPDLGPMCFQHARRSTLERYERFDMDPKPSEHML